MHFLIDFCAHRLVLQRCSAPIRPIKTVVLWTCDDFFRIAFGMCFASENLPKTHQNDFQTMTKSKPKTSWFSTLIFSRFWHRFWPLLAFQVGAKLAQHTLHNLDKPVRKPIGDDRRVWGWFGQDFGGVWGSFGNVWRGSSDVKRTNIRGNCNKNRYSVGNSFGKF